VIARKSANHSRSAAAGRIGESATGWPAVPTVFYDGACQLCRREIGHYRRLDRAARIVWLDISQDTAALQAHGLSLEAAMERLHVLDADGVMQTGAYGFATLWDALPGYRWLSRTLRVTRTLARLDRAYAVFARWRLQHRCGSSDCARPRSTRRGRMRLPQDVTRRRQSEPRDNKGEQPCA